MKYSEQEINEIKKIISNRKDRNELTNCCFYVTVPEFKEAVVEFTTSLPIKMVTQILIRNKVNYHVCDTIPGAFDLNRNFIETLSPIKCAIEYSGAYPAEWNLNDVLLLKEMEHQGLIYILVYYLDKNGKIKTWNQ